MAQQQQTVLRVETNVQPEITTSGNTTMAVTYTSNMTVTGSGTTINPFTGVTTSTATSTLSQISFTITGGSGTLYYNIRVSEGDVGLQYIQNSISCFVDHANGYTTNNGGFREYNTQAEGATDAFLIRSFKVLEGDVARFQMWPGPSTGTSRIIAYVVADEETAPPAIKTFDSLDIYGDIPIKLNKSFAEIQDISKRNSDYSVGIQLPGSKKNNRFFESYFNVDTDSLYFDVTKRVPCQILINDERYFEGYMRLNKVNVINSKVEYDVTLYSNVADLFGKIGNNLLNDLDFNDIDFHFNHQFSLLNTMFSWRFNALTTVRTVPALWMYPVVHNGYNYTADTNNDAIVDVSGTTQATTRLYTSTVASGYTSYGAFTGAGGLEYRINSPKFPVIDNQLKPGLSVWGLIQLMFKTYGYSIKSDFFNTPWFKLLYVYGVYGSDTTKFSRKITSIEQFPLDGVDVIGNFGRFVLGAASNFYVVKKGTGIPCYCSQAISFRVILTNLLGQQVGPVTVNIPPLSTGTTINLPNVSGWYIGLVPGSSNVTTSNRAMTYLPQPVGTLLPIIDGDNVDFSEIIDSSFKQIDILSSIAKKFDLVFIPDPDVPNQIIIEPYDYYVGTGQVHDWTDKLSYDKGFTVEPALNFIESEIILTDLEDGDDGNKVFKDRNNRVYGENKVTNPTDFKSQTKKIDTIFSPELIRKWDDRVSIPLGINYASQSKPAETGNKQKVTWEYKGIKSKPKLFFFEGIFSPFIDQVGEYYNYGSSWRLNTTYFRLQKSNRTNYANNEYALGSLGNPIVSHTMPMGNKDSNKNGRGFNNDSLCILFNSEEPGDIGLGIPTFNTYTENDIYSSFYSNRIDNIYNKNTRFLSGQFDLKLSDIKTLRYNDLIKIKDQYFVLNKISDYNYTNPELTKVELIQSNVEPKQYPDRYFFYQYCSGSTTTYKFKTYFNPEENDGLTYGDELPNSMRKTYFFWAVLYDYMIGALGGNATGYTSSVSWSTNGSVYPYNIREVSKDEYESTGVSHIYDPNNYFFIDRVNNFPSTFVIEENDYVYAFANTGLTQQSVMFNVGLNCAAFNQTAKSTGIVLSPGGATLPIPTPTPTSTPAPTPTPDPMIGSLLMTFNEFNDGRGVPAYQVAVNGLLRDIHFTDIDNLYSTFIRPGDAVNITVYDFAPSEQVNYSVLRLDYTTDDEGNDMGIKEVPISVTPFTGSNFSIIDFTASTATNAYNFEYKVSASIQIIPPTPPPNDGRFILASTSDNRLFLSTNTGSTFNDITPAGKFGIPTLALTDIAMSRDASNILLAYVDNLNNAQYLFKSTNSGTTFNALSGSGTGSWNMVNCSSDGKYVAAQRSNGLYYISNDSGTTFTAVSGSYTDEGHIEGFITDNGYPQYASLYHNVQFVSFSGYTYPKKLSSSGSTFSNITQLPTGSWLTYGSNDGKFQIIGQNRVRQTGTTINDLDSKIYISQDSGTTYTQKFSGSTNWVIINADVDMSGSNMVISHAGSTLVPDYPPYTPNVPSRIMYSNDSGSTWATSSISTPFPSPYYYTDVANSMTGKYVYGSYIPNNYPLSPGNKIVFSSDNGANFNSQLTISQMTGSHYINILKTNK
jgi:hypothetical protein